MLHMDKVRHNQAGKFDLLSSSQTNITPLFISLYNVRRKSFNFRVWQTFIVVLFICLIMHEFLLQIQITGQFHSAMLRAYATDVTYCCSSLLLFISSQTCKDFIIKFIGSASSFLWPFNPINRRWNLSWISARYFTILHS